VASRLYSKTLHPQSLHLRPASSCPSRRSMQGAVSVQSQPQAPAYVSLPHDRADSSDRYTTPSKEALTLGWCRGSGRCGVLLSRLRSSAGGGEASCPATTYDHHQDAGTATLLYSPVEVKSARPPML